MSINQISFSNRRSSSNSMTSLSDYSSSFHSKPSAPWSLTSRNLEMGHFLDQGFFSVVYKARSGFDQVEYAIKRISVGNFVNIIDTKTHNSGTLYFEKLLR